MSKAGDVRRATTWLILTAFLPFALAFFVLQWSASESQAEVIGYQPSADQEELDPLTIPKFAHELPIPQVFAPTVIKGKGGQVIRHEYNVSTAHTRVQMLPPGFPNFFPMTTVLGYGGLVKSPGSNRTEFVLASPGPVFENTRGIPNRLTWMNQIREPHFLPVDPVLHWANPLAMEPPVPPFVPFPPGYADAQFPVPAVTHTHGLVVAPQFDGTAEEWFTPFNHRGPSFVSNTYEMPNEQPPTQLFYHDHAMGITRLSLYAGRVGPAYFIRDPNSPLDQPDSPLPKGEFEIPLIIFDRAFFTDGELNFPRASDNPDLAYWQAETEADVVVVNGKVWPNLNVKRQQYRFRVLAASNERVWTFQFDNNGAFVPFTIIGSDGGYLPAPQVVDEVTQGITERADILVDFSQFLAGTKITMVNTHAIFDPETGETVVPDPDTVGKIMQFTVVESAAVSPPPLDASLFPSRANLPTDAPTRTKVLVRFRDDTDTNRLRSQDGLQFATPPTEFPLVGSTEQWDLVHTGEVDTDADAGTHMIHLHLIEFQVLNRQEFDAEAYLQQWHLINGHRPMTRPIVLDPTPFLIGDPIPPDPVETGWKDTVRSDPGFVTRIVARWAPQEVSTGEVAPGENLFPVDTEFPSETDTFSGAGYVWHCHLVGHEDHDMMRQLPVIKAWAAEDDDEGYPVGRVVAHENINYRVRVAHTPQASEPPPTRFDLWERVNNNDGTWQPQIIYAVGDRVLHEGLIYEALHVHQSQAEQAPPANPQLWEPLPMTACGQLTEFCHDPAHVPPVLELLAAQFHAIGHAGNEQACLDVLARGLAVCKHVHAMPCSGLSENPIMISVPDGTSFTSAGADASYETTSQLFNITVLSGSPGAMVTVNGRETKPGVNYPLPPQRNHGYCIQTVGGANFTAR